MQNSSPDRSSSLLESWYVLWLTALVSLLGAVLEVVAGYRAVGFLFLVFVMLLGLVYSVGPVLFAAGLSALVWNYLFIPPRFKFFVSNSEDFMMLLSYAVAAGVIGVLTHRLRRMQELSALRDRSSLFLVDFSKILASDQGRDAVALKAMEKIEARFKLRVGLGFAEGSTFLSPQQMMVGDREKALMQKALKEGSFQGWDGLSPRHLAIPLQGAAGPSAVLLCRRDSDTQLNQESKELLFATTEPLAYFLQREKLREKSLEAARLRESEFLHQALLDSVSHELRTPLTSLLGSTAALEHSVKASDLGPNRELLEEIKASGERLNRVIENLLDMARLNSGALALKKEWHDPAELVQLTLQGLKAPLSGHVLKLELAPELPLVRMDYRLLEHALSNLILNAAGYAPPGTEICVSASVHDGNLEWRVADQGPGIPEGNLERVFEKLFRIPGSPAGGTGLGLYIARSLLKAHGGDAWAVRRPSGGAEFILSLPLEPSPGLPGELAA